MNILDKRGKPSIFIHRQNLIFMKKILSICIGFLLLEAVYAQKAPEEVFYKNELGLNISNFITRFIDFSASGGGYSVSYPYLFEYWKRIDRKNAFRVSLDGDYSERNDKGTQSSGGDSPRRDYFIRTRVGYFKTTQFGKRWEAYGGVDLLYYYHNEQVKRSYNNGYDLSIKEKEYGGGGVVGLTFKLHNRLTISTEGDLYLEVNRGKEIRKDSDDPSFRQEETNKGANLNFYTPLDIRLSFRF